MRSGMAAGMDFAGMVPVDMCFVDFAGTVPVDIYSVDSAGMAAVDMYSVDSAGTVPADMYSAGTRPVLVFETDPDCLNCCYPSLSPFK